MRLSLFLSFISFYLFPLFQSNKQTKINIKKLPMFVILFILVFFSHCICICVWLNNTHKYKVNRASHAHLVTCSSESKRQTNKQTNNLRTCKDKELTLFFLLYLKHFSSIRFSLPFICQYLNEMEIKKKKEREKTDLRKQENGFKQSASCELFFSN